MRQKSSHLKACLISLAAYSSWVGTDVFWKLLGSTDIPKTETVGISSIFTVIILLILGAARGRLWALKTNKLKSELIRSFLIVSLAMAGITSVTVLPLTIFYIGNFAAPIISSVLAIFLLREKPSFLQLTAIIAGFLGVVIAIDPFSVDMSGTQKIGYIALAVFPLITSAATIMLRTVCASETPDSAAFIPQLMRMLIFVPMSLLWFKMPNATELLYMFFAGACNAGGFFLTATAIKHAPVHIVTPFNYSQIVMGAAIGFFVWNDIPGWNLWLGAAIIIASGLYIMLSKNEPKII